MSDLSERKVREWLDRIFRHEGGYSDEADDPGNWTGGVVGKGELRGTKYGISAAAYPDIDILSLTAAEASELYRRDYLQPIGAGRFREGVAFQLFDLAVNSGPARAVRLLQKAIGVVDDGVVGPVTLGRLRALSEGDVIMLVLAERLDFMRGLKGWSAFGNGWMRRIAENLRYGAADSD